MKSTLPAHSTFEIRTRRLVLRPLQLSDFKVWAEANRQTLPCQNEFDAGPMAGESCTRAVLRKMVADQKRLWAKDQFYGLSIFERKSGSLVGHLQLLPHVRIV